VDDNVKIWAPEDTSSAKVLDCTNFNVSLGVVSVASNFDGKLLAFSTMDGNITVCDMVEGKKVQIINPGGCKRSFWTLVRSKSESFLGYQLHRAL
jgi:hypothetical protein